MFIRCTAIIVLMNCGISMSAQNTLSVPFTNGFVGTVGNNSAKADNIQSFSTLGLTKVDFVQNSSGAVFEIQGNDIPGLVRFVSITGQSLDIEGAIVWRVNSGSTIEIFGFIPATTTSAVNLSTIGGSNYVLDASSNIGMRPNGGTFAIVDGDNISGNAASAGLLDALNDYLATVIVNRPAGSVTVNDESTTNSTPTLTGTVNYDTSVGETFTVNVDGVTYTTTSGISIVNQDWSLTLGATSIGTYEVTAVITDQSGYTLSNVGSLTISPPDITPPSITSGATGTDLVENSGAGQTIYTITATDAVGVTGYAIAGTDAALLSVNAGTGVVTLTADPDYEAKNSYSFTVTASDAATNTSAPTAVTFSITNVDEVNPTITSGTTGTNITENSGAGQTVYTITSDANDGGTIQSFAIAGTDAALLSVNAATGVVTLTADPDYETKNSYSFTVTATDETGTSTATTVTFSIVDVDDTAPVITSGATGTDLVENTGAGQTIYTITATDAVGVTSYAIAGTDAALLSVNAATGVVTLTADPNFNTKSSYSFTVTASDAATNTSDPTTVTFSVTSSDVIAPVITSGATGTDLVENSGAGQTIYTITATDAVGVTGYAIAGTDAALLSVNAATGVVTLTADPDYEAKNSYSFTVTASDAATNTSAPTAVTFSIVDVDDTAPVITSGATGTDLVENSGAGQTIYTITATDAVGVTGYAIAGTDAALLSVNAATGVVTLTADPNFNTKSSYSFTVTASDAATNTSDPTTVTFSVTSSDVIAPVITSGATGTDLVENSGAGQTIYTITATDAVGVTGYAIAGTDAALLSVNAGTGVVTLTADPDYEAKNSYSFTVTASDAATNTSAPTAVTFSITNVDEVNPTITSGTTGTNITENSGAGQTVYTITSDANDGGTIQSFAIAGTDAALLSVNAATGVVTLTADPDYETKNSYSFTVTATDETGTSTATTVTFSIVDVDDTAPVITSGATGTDLVENTGAGQTIYTITATDAVGVTGYAIAGTDAALLSVNAVTGVVTLTADPNFNTKSSYSFTVTASDAATNTSDPTTVTFSITFSVVHNLNACDGDSDATIDLDALHSSNGVWTYSLDSDISGFASSSLLGSILTVDFSGANTGSGTIELSAQSGGNSGSIDVVVQESLYPYVTNMVPDGCSNANAEDGGAVFTFSGNYGSPVTVHYYLNAVNIFDSGTAKFAGYGDVQTKDSDASGNWKSVSSGAYWLYGYTNARGCFNPEPATSGVPTSSPKIKLLTVPYLLD